MRGGRKVGELEPDLLGCGVMRAARGQQDKKRNEGRSEARGLGPWSNLLMQTLAK
jgi:hypothetical protein